MSKIMVVDDNKDIVETLKMIMEKEGYSVETANCGQDFLNKVEKVSPDLVLLDVMMPGLNTKEILFKLKEKGITGLKIILVTVVRFSDEEKEKLMTDFKIADYIAKPFEIYDIINAVKKHLNR